MPPARIAVLMACHNRRALTLRCLAALAAQPLFSARRLWLVDDGSTDATGDAVRALLPQAQVIAGSGDLFWNGGMRLAWAKARASTEACDFFLWLNDDVELAAEALAMLVADADAVAPRGQAVIIAAATTDPASGAVTYGAHRRVGGWRRLRLRLIEPDGAPQPADTISGNVVLVSAAAAARLGSLDARYRHIYGDLDYGLRARREGIPVALASRPAGRCAANAVAGSSLDPRLSRLGRIRLRLREERGLHARDWRCFVRAHGGGRLAVVAHTLSPYLRILAGRPHPEGAPR
ncbi:MAG: glycosyltransferase family 2 protein [Sphingomonadales bacterium]|nr:glycosyltransferase family 2 protein [Sphingomonadales bacterium]